MNGHWHAVWVLAAKRNDTKIGEDHLSQHCFTVLQEFVKEEAKAAMEASMGSITYFTIAPE